MAERKQPTRHEINAVIARVLGLPDLAKFEVFDALREDLVGALSEEKPDNRKVLERKEALVVMKLVAEELALDAGKAPTAKQFDSVVDQVAENWNSQRVVRLWERWRLAKDAYLGTRRIDSPASRKRRGRLKGATKWGEAQDGYLRSLKAWLASKPERLTRAAYDEFAELQNADLRVGEPPLHRAETIRRGLPIEWDNALAVARGDLTMERALEAELAERLPGRREYALLGLSSVAKLLNLNHVKAKELADTDRHFPNPVARIQGHRAWLYEDVKLYKRELAVPARSEDELQALFMDSEELRQLLSLGKRTLAMRIEQKRWSLVPQPEGAIAKNYRYWKRDKVEAWKTQRKEAERKVRTRASVGAKGARA